MKFLLLLNVLYCCQTIKLAAGTAGEPFKVKVIVKVIGQSEASHNKLPPRSGSSLEGVEPHP